MILLFLLISLSYASCARDSLIQCFSTYIDTNHDMAITPAELSAFFVVIHSLDKTAAIFRFCDLNSDNLLTMADWNATNACGTRPEIIGRMCMTCERLSVHHR